MITNTVIIDRLKEVLKHHDEAVTHESGTKMSHNVRKNAFMGLLRVQMALHLSLRMDIIQKSFKKTVHYPYDL